MIDDEKTPSEEATDAAAEIETDDAAEAQAERDAALDAELSATNEDDGEIDSGPPSYDELEAANAELKDHVLRARAEAENTRRRAEREKIDTANYAITKFARAIISVADNLHRALASVSDEARQADEELKNLCVGIEMTEAELVTVFEQFGIKPIEALGKKFDSNFHQAMFEVDDPDQPAGLVAQQMQLGFTIHDRLLRPAMVGVSKGGPKLEAEATEAAPGDDKAGPAAEPLSAYEKQSDAADREADGVNPQVDKKL
ncbi:MAG: nucleotide exchange factor GrpE [Rhodospirillales bacterium]|nr:nucleotide exchange factor GrpE [Rhodospirillales bacterium]